jgi:acyl carrier protein
VPGFAARRKRGSILATLPDMLRKEMIESLNGRIKKLMVDNLMLQVTEAEIGDDQLLFGPGSLGLDSVDALQLVVALDKNFGLKIPDPATAKEVLQSVNTMVAAVRKHQETHPPTESL